MYSSPASSERYCAADCVAQATGRLSGACPTRRGPDSALWQDHDLVFPSPLGTPLDPSNVRRYFNKICHDAGVDQRRLHDWRVTTASWLADLNIHPDTARQTTRHSQSATLMEFYTQASSDSRRAAIEALDRLFNE